MSIQFAPTWNNASVVQTCIRANATDTASAAASTLIDLSVNGVSQFSVDKTGDVILRESTPQTPPSGYITLYGSSGRLNVINSAGSTTSIIGSINGLTDSTQTFSVGTSGTNFAISSASGVHTFSLPDASATARGVVTTGAQTFAGAKTFSTKVTVPATGTTAGGIGNGANGIDFFGGILTYVSGPAYPTYTGTSGGVPFFRLAQNAVLEWSGNDNDAYTTSNTAIGRWESGHVSVRFGLTSCKLSVTNSFTNAANYERAILQFVTYSSARYAQLACESAGAGIANMNLVLSPKGTGALIAGPMPDGTATGGNARGANAIDLQTIRTAATQVASGSTSVAIGGNSTASATNGIAIGNTAASTGGSNGRSIAIGNGATASAEYAISIGPQSGATGAGAICISNEGGTASGNGSTYIGAAGGGASGTCSLALGASAVASRTNEIAFGFRHNLFSVRPGAFLLSCKTTDANFTALAGNNIFQSAIAWTTRTDTVIQGILQVLGVKSDGSAVASYTRKVIFKNVGGTITLVQSETIGIDFEDNANTDIEITNTTPFFRVKGIASETWRWSGWFGPTLEMAYGT